MNIEAESSNGKASNRRIRLRVAIGGCAVVATLLILTLLRLPVTLVYPAPPPPNYEAFAAWCYAGAAFVALTLLLALILGRTRTVYIRAFALSTIVALGCLLLGLISL